MKKIILLTILPLLVYAQTAINLTGMGVEINNFGRLRLYYPNLAGKQYFENISILVATAPGTVFDYYQDAGMLDTVRPQPRTAASDTGIIALYDNSYSNLPPEIIVRQALYGWNNSPFILVQYTIINNDTIPINAITGLEIVPELEGYFGNDTITYNFDKQYFRIFKRNSYAGFKYLALDNGQITSLSPFNWYPLYQKDSLYYQLMTKNIADSTWYSNDLGAVVVTGHNQLTLAPKQETSFYYAITLAQNDSTLSSNLDAALVKYNRLTTGVQNEIAELPAEYELYQNYPNPFNPSTVISFSISKEQHIVLNVYNILGQKVKTLMDDIKPSGKYMINFNASSLPSGVYIYRLEGEGINLSRKMMLIK